MAEKKDAPETVSVIAHHLIYHTAGQAPAMPGSVVELPEAEASRLHARGAVRRRNAPPPLRQSLSTPPETADAAPTPAPGAETIPIPPAPEKKP